MTCEWRNIIHRENPYDGFPIDNWVPRIEGWGHDSVIFEEAIKLAKPGKIIEVGSWLGASAINMAAMLEKHQIDAEILCVDTWLGCADTWLNMADPRCGSMCTHGHPNLYHQFLANIIHSKRTDVITPFPIDSANGARFLKIKQMFADIIYIDANHEHKPVLTDITMFWDVLKPGGIMIGDDYSLAWPGVVRAVWEFAENHSCVMDLNYSGKWALKKP